ncbi:mitochondrial sodium/calcium exchanger protein-like [Ornithodoros turicata]|uniref:mitochondrial sodium/calcium exchanger protein-like n=1 Tax=Ornithodoros turicata TaxID=34597 RepID=UPI0031390F79
MDVHGGVDCELLHSLNSTWQQCVFVKETAQCHEDEAFIPYITFVYCGGGAPYGPLCVLILWLVLLFIMLGTSADDFLCPALVVVSKTLKISESLAGVTLLAFGNGAPDIISAISGVQQQRPSLVAGGLFGAGTFVTAVVAGLVFILCRFDIDSGAFLRNIIFYLVGSFWLFFVFYDGYMTLIHAVGFLVLYASYISSVLLGQIRWTPSADLVVNDTETAAPTREGKIDGNLLSVPDRPPYLSANSTGADLLPVAGDTEDQRTRRRRSSSAASIHRHHEHAIASVLHGSAESTVSFSESPNAHRRIVRVRDGSVSEQTPLLREESSRTEDAEFQRGHCQELLVQLFPFDAEWSATRNCIGKAYDIVIFPLRLILTLTIPVVDFANDKSNWCRPLNTLHCITAPLAVCAILGKANVQVGGVLPLWSVVTMLGLLLAVLVWTTSEFDRAPRYHVAYGFLGFIVSLLWIYGVAQELLGLLRTLGVVANVSDALLGLTVLAWGNSIGDLVTNITVARQGFPNMAVAACFGGPLLNMLLGIGISYTWLLTRTPSHRLQLEYAPLLSVLYPGLVSSLCTSLVVTLLVWYKSSRLHGCFLLSLYAVFLILAILKEMDVL